MFFDTLKFNDSRIRRFNIQKFSDEEETALRMKYLHLFESRIPLTSLEIDTKHQSEPEESFSNMQISYSRQTFVDNDCCEELMSVCGILLPKVRTTVPKKINRDDNIVLVQSIKNNLRQISLSVSNATPVIVQGPVGSGKTSLIEYLAAAVGRHSVPHLTKVQMGDQVDSKALIGTYCCTDIPGEFVWKSGPLTNAMVDGHWLLLEDIDCAPCDVLTTLSAVLETKSLSTLPGCSNRVERLHSDFRIFFTRRIISGHYHDATFSEFSSHNRTIIDKFCNVVTLKYLCREELTEIISVKWPVLSKITERVLEIYFNLLDGSSKEDLATGRPISLRDLVKWCKRIAQDLR